MGNAQMVALAVSGGGPAGAAPPSSAGAFIPAGSVGAAGAFTPSDGFFLTDAARNGNVDVLRLFLRKNPALVYAVARDGSTAWHIAAEQGNAEVLQLLISTTRDAAVSNTFSPLAKVINTLNSRSQTALMLACRGGHAAAAELLLDNGAQLFVADVSGCTALHHAALCPPPEAPQQQGTIARPGCAELVVRHLCDKARADAPAPAVAAAASSKLLNATDSYGRTPLHYAAWSGNTAAAHALWVAGADLLPRTTSDCYDSDLPCNTGTTPLHFAAMRGHQPIVLLLLAAWLRSTAALPDPESAPAPAAGEPAAGAGDANGADAPGPGSGTGAEVDEAEAQALLVPAAGGAAGGAAGSVLLQGQGSAAAVPRPTGAGAAAAAEGPAASQVLDPRLMVDAYGNTPYSIACKRRQSPGHMMIELLDPSAELDLAFAGLTPSDDDDDDGEPSDSSSSSGSSSSGDEGGDGAGEGRDGGRLPLLHGRRRGDGEGAAGGPVLLWQGVELVQRLAADPTAFASLAAAAPLLQPQHEPAPPMGGGGSGSAGQSQRPSGAVPSDAAAAPGRASIGSSSAVGSAGLRPSNAASAFGGSTTSTIGEDVPDCFLCPMTCELFRDPVVAADGMTYEREAVERHLRLVQTSPCTKQRLPTATLYPNKALKAAIAFWKQQQ